MALLILVLGGTADVGFGSKVTTCGGDADGNVTPETQAALGLHSQCLAALETKLIHQITHQIIQVRVLL